MPETAWKYFSVRRSQISDTNSLFGTSPACPSDKCGIVMEMSVERWWNDTDRGKLKYWERNI